MKTFKATHLITIDFKSRQGWGSHTSWDDINREITDFIFRMTIEIKGKRYWKRYASKGNQRLIPAYGDVHFGNTGDFPHAHIQVAKPAWCDETRFVNAAHKIARMSPLARKDASAVDVRASDYSLVVQEYGIKEDRRSY